jgi:hypothetical protein
LSVIKWRWIDYLEKLDFWTYRIFKWYFEELLFRVHSAIGRMIDSKSRELIDHSGRKNSLPITVGGFTMVSINDAIT